MHHQWWFWKDENGPAAGQLSEAENVCYFCYVYPSYERFFVISELGAVSLM